MAICLNIFVNHTTFSIQNKIFTARVQRNEERVQVSRDVWQLCHQDLLDAAPVLSRCGGQAQGQIRRGIAGHFR